MAERAIAICRPLSMSGRAMSASFSAINVRNALAGPASRISASTRASSKDMPGILWQAAGKRNLESGGYSSTSSTLHGQFARPSGRHFLQLRNFQRQPQVILVVQERNLPGRNVEVGEEGGRRSVEGEHSRVA